MTRILSTLSLIHMLNRKEIKSEINRKAFTCLKLNMLRTWLKSNLNIFHSNWIKRVFKECILMKIRLKLYDLI